MFLRTVKSEGLAHLSYIVGDGGCAAVIDPRRDCDVYVDIAYGEGARIDYIFETHRNEDYVIGSQELARQTGARILHSGETDFAYGEVAKEGDEFSVGSLLLRVLETPGHTLDSISLVLADTEYGDDPVAVFTGDALFIGDVGRTDFYPDRAKEVAGMLHDSIFEKLLPLGDHVILHPAHGAGSVCGSGMADREFSTLGYERAHNPVLRLPDRDAFIEHKLGERHAIPPYFSTMERYNQKGAPALHALPRPKPEGPSRFADAAGDGMQVLDTRSPEAFAGAFVPGSLAIPLEMIPAYAGWFLRDDADIGLIVSDPGEVERAVRHLIRIGYDRIVCHLAGGMAAWETSGREYGSIPNLFAGDLKRRIETEEPFTLLDVRSVEEYEQGHIAGSNHIHLGELPDRLDEIARARPITTFCGSGIRAITAASILRRNGFERVENCLGSMAACSAVGCPTE